VGCRRVVLNKEVKHRCISAVILSGKKGKTRVGGRDKPAVDTGRAPRTTTFYFQEEEGWNGAARYTKRAKIEKMPWHTQTSIEKKKKAGLERG